MNMVNNVISSVRVRYPNSNFPGTLEEFRKLLDELRPSYSKVEARLRRQGRDVSALILADGEIVHILEGGHLPPGEIEQEISNLLDFYRNPPTLWPGCRGDLARKLGVQVGTPEFNRWFDSMADQL